MQSLRIRSCATFAIVLGQHVLVTHAAWQDKAWVRKYPCGDSHGSSPELEVDNGAFWIDSLRGTWNNLGDSAEMELNILAVHNERLISCKDVDLLSFQNSLEFQSLGQQVGQLQHMQSHCPLPITDALTP